jgi:hypothetical protein
MTEHRTGALPWVRIDKPYEFETDEGTKSLAELARDGVPADRGGAMSTGGVLAALPIVVSAVPVQRHLVPGLTMGAVK